MFAAPRVGHLADQCRSALNMHLHNTARVREHLYPADLLRHTLPEAAGARWPRPRTVCWVCRSLSSSQLRGFFGHTNDPRQLSSDFFHGLNNSALPGVVASLAGVVGATLTETPAIAEQGGEGLPLPSEPSTVPSNIAQSWGKSWCTSAPAGGRPAPPTS
ncbi:hypothetical protein E2C01_009724 [Portunus trituberculatus]|uniref:Uncharacterized protein n=1 Tax=Portunus trituberculatus TaxID=210409 RepID=A0A5B7D6S5_PORTR|nr:hypothetical protein [Portunus trituberculatus]